MSREVHVRFSESLGVRFPRATRRVTRAANRSNFKEHATAPTGQIPGSTEFSPDDKGTRSGFLGIEAQA
jgi:hypothetical protein